MPYLNWSGVSQTTFFCIGVRQTFQENVCFNFPASSLPTHYWRCSREIRSKGTEGQCFYSRLEVSKYHHFAKVDHQMNTRKWRNNKHKNTKMKHKNTKWNIILLTNVRRKHGIATSRKQPRRFHWSKRLEVNPTLIEIADALFCASLTTSFFSRNLRYNILLTPAFGECLNSTSY